MTPTPAAVEALKLAVEWLKSDEMNAGPRTVKAIEVVLAALAHQPTANTPAHTPPTGVSGAVQAKREPLTAEQLSEIFLMATGHPDYSARVARAIERAHGIGAAGEGAEPDAATKEASQP